MARVDVITPTIAGREHLLADASESVLHQSRSADACHIIGPDETHIGPGFVRNELVRIYGRSEWLVFLDDDDLLDTHFIEWMLAAAEEQKRDIVYAPCRYPPNAPWRPPIGKFDADRLRSSNYIPVTVLMRRSLFESVGGFRTSAPYEDWHLWLDLLDKGVVFGYFPHVCWTYRLHGHPWRPVH